MDLDLDVDLDWLCAKKRRSQGLCMLLQLGFGLHDEIFMVWLGFALNLDLDVNLDCLCTKRVTAWICAMISQLGFGAS